MIITKRTVKFGIPLFIAALFFCCQDRTGHYTFPLTQPLESDAAYVQLILTADTLSVSAYQQRLKAVLKEMKQRGDTSAQSYYFYFKGCQYQLNKQPDSALLAFKNIIAAPQYLELQILTKIAHLTQLSSGSAVVDEDLSSAALACLKEAEAKKSKFVYQVYDVMAKFYYYNDDLPKAITYTRLYYNAHPFKNHPMVKQRYYDISCMLAGGTANHVEMQRYVDSARVLAVALKDSIALARTDDYQGQVLSMQGKFTDAVYYHKKNFLYFKGKNRLSSVVYNNLATALVRDNQLDSAIYYYQECILWAKASARPANLISTYGGLRECYQKKGLYKEALVALDSSFQIYGRNQEAINASRIEELHTRYESDKKDHEIGALEDRNALSNKVIKQQRWIFIGIFATLALVVFYAFTVYRQRLLKEKNEKLKLDNKRLILEQKTRQMQLDPHFIYNAIANLQGLISTDKKEAANAYLVSFSRLMRNILELNREDLISINEEIQALGNYLDLQKMRYEDAFTYRIVTKDLNTEMLMVPPMIIQPFVENAIEHGFQNIDYIGALFVSFERDEERLKITIQDNGSGNKYTGQGKPVKKSLSRLLVQERLDLLFNQEDKKAFFRIDEGANGFTIVMYLPLITD